MSLSQTIANNTCVLFKRDKTYSIEEWGEGFENIGQYDGQTCIATFVASAYSGSRRDESYDIEFSDGTIFPAVSGVNLFDITMTPIEKIIRYIDENQKDAILNAAEYRYILGQVLEQLKDLKK